MNIFMDVIKELFSMFVADARLSLSILALVCLVSLLVKTETMEPVTGGILLLAGSLTILVLAALRKRPR